MARPLKFKQQEVIDAIRKAHTAKGAADVLGCDSDTIRAYAKRYPKVEAVLYNERRDLVDLAQRGLRNALENEEAWAVAFTLKTLGKEDGFTERTEVTGADGRPMALQIEYVNDWRDA